MRMRHETQMADFGTRARKVSMCCAHVTCAHGNRLRRQILVQDLGLCWCVWDRYMSRVQASMDSDGRFWYRNLDRDAVRVFYSTCKPTCANSGYVCVLISESKVFTHIPWCKNTGCVSVFTARNFVSMPALMLSTLFGSILTETILQTLFLVDFPRLARYCIDTQAGFEGNTVFLTLDTRQMMLDDWNSRFHESDTAVDDR